MGAVEAKVGGVGAVEGEGCFSCADPVCLQVWEGVPRVAVVVVDGQIVD